MPNGASAVGGAHRTASTRTYALLNPEAVIKEEEVGEKTSVVLALERKLSLQQEEIARRQTVIERLEAELLREKRVKHANHICENCS